MHQACCHLGVLALRTASLILILSPATGRARGAFPLALGGPRAGPRLPFPLVVVGEPLLPVYLDGADVIQRIGDQRLQFGESLRVLIPDELMDDV